MREAYPDPTAKEGDWSAVDLVPKKPLRTAGTLEEIKGNARLKEMALLRCSRLSVQPVKRGVSEISNGEIIRAGAA